MRVFVVGTGRCGTVTFSKACQFFPDFTCRHESKTKNLHLDLTFPNKHIEVDPHLFWFIPQLLEKYPTAKIVHLQRERSSCVKSLSKRNSLMHYCNFTSMSREADLKHVAQNYYNFVNGTLDLMSSKKTYFHFQLENFEKDWLSFADFINQPLSSKSIAVFGEKHNASK